MPNTPNPVMGTYGRFPITLTRGKGSEVYDDTGKRYLDFLGGISVNALGHCPEGAKEALLAQIDQLWHVSNLYHIEPQKALAQELVNHSDFDQVFFCNSGTEANEAALKLGRIATAKCGRGQRPITVAMNQSFHGRSYGSLSVTGQAAYREPFEPLLPQVRFADFGDLKSLEAQLDNQVAAVILEPLQAEGGLNSPPPGYLEGVRELCDRYGAWLIFDEVQVGIGRLCQPFAYQHFGVTPDIMTLAKALGGGFPIGAMLASHEVSQHFVPGTHASTFGGNPLACSSALATIKTIFKKDFLEQTRQTAAIIAADLDSCVQRYDSVLMKKGEGMLTGLKLSQPVGPLVKACLEAGLLVGSASSRVLRLAPALNLSLDIWKEGFAILNTQLEAFKA
jgi:acetylornithine aminotransferase/acetylornithine/N-succinyldiaminopimelate aminotransferase